MQALSLRPISQGNMPRKLHTSGQPRLYNDYSISETLFYWQSQSTTAADERVMWYRRIP